MFRKILFILLFNLIFCHASLLVIEDDLEKRSFYFKYHKPESISNDPINFYSLIHFLEYGALSFISKIKTRHFWFISLGWEFFELFLFFDWARESWVNKICDLFFNWSGFYFFRKLFNRK